ncbi:AAA family ATPase [Aliivibrio fischeri]|uniref:ParA family protein n=1 Tax=Aliivibrio fischeri TaxID=668 RepID=UPI0012D980F8|nr:AAA family ATPase [Aliivibrio fischeri]MUJ26322.1 AAA family ATPase [Aliivibrio fischeri]MUK39529.1 AAA family ATPase [Aliivibrio fischeri]MUL07571.1 AAA family ATPase [Aliivibrio fischeri]
MSQPKIINIVSGKGGTGKTLLTAVLADLLGNENHSTLIVDLDVFVRGLTSLLYYHKKERIELIESNEISIADFFIDKGDMERSGSHKIATSRYRTFDVAPSVSRVDEVLKFTDLMPDTKSEAITLLNALIKKVHNKYDFILLDSRAGYDELIAASHFISDVTICVEEEDSISKITSNNLINQLKEDSDSPIFRLSNKTRTESVNMEYSSGGVEYLGAVPFDMDVMRSFGTKYFWDDISRTIYKSSIARSWNNLSNKLGWNITVDEFRSKPFGNENVERKLQFFSVKDRILLVYGLIIGFIGAIYPLIDLMWIREVLKEPEGMLRVVSMITGALGFSMAAWVLFKNKK